MDFEDAVTGYVGVTGCCAEAGMAQEALDIAYVGSGFQEMGCKGVAQAVDGGFFHYVGAGSGFLGQNCAAIFSAFAQFYIDHHPGEIYVFSF